LADEEPAATAEHDDEAVRYLARHRGGKILGPAPVAAAMGDPASTYVMSQCNLRVAQPTSILAP
jgi:hypothetical protein